MAKEALTGYLQSVDARKMRLPDPSQLEGDEVVYLSKNRESFKNQSDTENDYESRKGPQSKTGQSLDNFERSSEHDRRKLRKGQPSARIVLADVEAFGA